MRNDAYSREYLPVIGWLRLHGAPSRMVIGPSELGFELGFTPRLADDFRLGYNSGKRPDLIVIDPNYRAEMDRIRAAHPEIGAYLDRRFQPNTGSIFDDVYTIYRQVASADEPVLSKSRLKGMPSSPGSGD